MALPRILPNCLRLVAVVLAFAAAVPGTGSAATLEAGPGKTYKLPSAAIKAAHDGDTVLIAPGTYFDCAIVRQNKLTIAGSAPDAAAILTDKTCGGKALLVTAGNDITVRNLTLTRARVPDGNGAGIRAEGRGLTIDHVKFINNQDGILAASQPDGTITIRDSTFLQNGLCDPKCGHGVYVNGLGLLRIVHSTFGQARGGDHVRAMARRAELVGNGFTDEGGHMAGPLILVSGGSLLLEDNTLELQARTENRPGAVLVTGEAADLVARGNTLREISGAGVPLLRNWTGQAVSAKDNRVPPGVSAVSDAGATYHRLRGQLASLRDSLRAAAGRAKHVLARLIRWSM